VLSAVEI